MRSPKVPWWPGSVVSDSGVHLHHLVFGIVTMMIAGTLGFAALGDSPYAEICAFFFGVGAGLTIDEFALWVYLDDVYWAEEGRSSIDATVIAAAAMLLVVLGFNPFDIEHRHRRRRDRRRSPPAAILFTLVAICFFKGRDLHGIIGFFFFPIAIYGACRIGKPRLGLGAAPLRRAAAEEAGEGRSGASRPTAAPSASRKPSATSSAASRARASPPRRDEAMAATREASEEVRKRAEQVAHPIERRATRERERD